MREGSGETGPRQSGAGSGPGARRSGLDRLSEMARSAQDPPLPNDLPVRLRRASAPELKVLLRDYGRFFTLPQVRQLLLNPFVDAEILQELATIRTLVALHPVRVAICKHPRTPEPVAMRWIPDLFWRELLEVTVDVRIRGSVRTVAERYLLERLPRLTEGEKVALARRATASTAKQLARKADRRVLMALLDNPRTTEAALMPLLTDDEASPKALAEVAAHGRWMTRYEIVLALCLNPQTPFRQVFELLPRLTRQDLKSVCGQAKHSSVVVHEAEKVLAGRPAVQELPSPYTLEPDAVINGISTLDTEDSDTLE